MTIGIVGVKMWHYSKISLEDFEKHAIRYSKNYILSICYSYWRKY